MMNSAPEACICLLLTVLPWTTFSSLEMPSSISVLETEFINCVLDICNKYSNMYEGVVVTSHNLILTKEVKRGNIPSYDFITEAMLHEMNKSENLTSFVSAERVKDYQHLCKGGLTHFAGFIFAGVFIMDEHNFVGHNNSFQINMMSCLLWHNPDSFFIIVDTRKNIPPGSHELIFSMLLVNCKFVNVVILSDTHDVKYERPIIAVKGWFPLRNGNITSGWITSTTTLSYYWRSEFGEKQNSFANVDLFPSKRVNNFEGSTVFMKPDAEGIPHIFVNVDENTQLLTASGPLAYFLEIAANRLNFTVKYSSRINNEIMTGIKGPVFLWSTKRDSDFIHPYGMGGFTWYIPTCRRLPYWQSIIRVFSSKLWIMVLSSYLIISFVLWIFESANLNRSRSDSETISNILIYTMSPLLGNSGNIHFKKVVSILLFSLWLFYSLQINTAYQSSLVGYLTNPGELPLLKTIKELESSGIELTMVAQEEESFDGLIDILKDEGMRTNGIKRKSKLGSNLNTFLETGCNVAFLAVTPMHDYIVYMSGFYNGKPLFIAMNKGIAYSNLALRCFKGSFLWEPLDEIFFQLQSSGIFNKWVQDLYENDTIKREHQTSAHLIALSLKNLQGAFYILVIGLAVAFFAILYELILGTDSTKEIRDWKVEENM
ncbi:Ionotropic receptor 921 [Blattella germanica]|nr:Ionotropic receptor 921 [Blattella germanica]